MGAPFNFYRPSHAPGILLLNATNPEEHVTDIAFREHRGGGDQRSPNPDRVLYLPDSMVVRVLDTIDRPTAYWLADEIDHGRTYYGYQTVEIQLDSPGGDATALHYLIARFGEWQEHGLTVQTVGLGRVASAAAILLSLGTPGHRWVCQHAMLLYHCPRVLARRGESWTVDALEHAAYMLRLNEDLVLKRLLQATTAGSDKQHKRELLMRLLREERWITPMEAITEYDLADHMRK